MESQDQKAAISRLVSLLRKLTRVVQIIPFAYLALYVLMLLTEGLLPESVLCVEDIFFTISPAATIGMLGLSRVLRLCRWHKAACLFPTNTHIINGIDTQLFQFTQNEIVAINITLSIIATAFLVVAYIHFFHGRKKAAL